MLMIRRMCWIGLEKLGAGFSQGLRALRFNLYFCQNIEKNLTTSLWGLMYPLCNVHSCVLLSVLQTRKSFTGWTNQWNTSMFSNELPYASCFVLRLLARDVNLRSKDGGKEILFFLSCQSIRHQSLAFRSGIFSQRKCGERNAWWVGRVYIDSVGSVFSMCNIPK